MLIAALVAVYFAPRAGLYQESCATRSCLKILNLKCINGTCLCDSDYVYIDKCVLKKNYFEKCHLTSACRDNKNMVCLNGVCSCDEKSYWTGTLCFPKSTYQQASTNNNQCLSSQYLYSDTKLKKCICDNYTRFWDQTSCFPKRTLNERCNANYECRGWENTYCLYGYCSCLRVIQNETYWNGGSCAQAVSYNQPCTNATSSYMCKMLTEGTTCNGPYPYKCSCATLQYYNSASKKCTAHVSFGVACAQTDACRSDLGLICQNGVCQCNTATQFWNGINCVNYYTYNGGTCASDSECNNLVTNLICKTAISGTTCSCPTSISNGLCDCPTRVVNNEFYWNGAYCVSSGGHGSFCTNNFHCKVLTLQLECDTTTFSCVCANGLWDSENQICAPCDNGWSYHKNACYEAVYLPITGFQDLTTTNIATYCVNSKSVNVALAPQSDFSTSDLNWLNANICSASNTINIWYFGPVNSVSCAVYACSNGQFTTHDCSHGESHHGLICKYT